MAPADAEHGFSFIAFDCPVYTLAVLMAYLGPDVRRVDRWLLAWCELMPRRAVILFHALKELIVA
jgi:hypothetical protein